MERGRVPLTRLHMLSPALLAFSPRSPLTCVALSHLAPPVPPCPSLHFSILWLLSFSFALSSLPFTHRCRPQCPCGHSSPSPPPPQAQLPCHPPFAGVTTADKTAPPASASAPPSGPEVTPEEVASGVHWGVRVLLCGGMPLEQLHHTKAPQVGKSSLSMEDARLF